MKLNIDWKMNIPNALSLFRLVLLPVFAVLFLNSEKDISLRYWSFGVLVISGITDSLDGIIARRFNQITDLGKILDPVADKITQVIVVLCLAFQYSVLIPIVILCFAKELAQGIGGLLLIKNGAKIEGAKWYGKVSTFAFYGVMALIVAFPSMTYAVRAALIALVAICMLFAFYKYMRVFMSIHKQSAVQPEHPSTINEKNAG